MMQMHADRHRARVRANRCSSTCIHELAFNNALPLTSILYHLCLHAFVCVCERVYVLLYVCVLFVMLSACLFASACACIHVCVRTKTPPFTPHHLTSSITNCLAQVPCFSFCFLFLMFSLASFPPLFTQKAPAFRGTVPNGTVTKTNSANLPALSNEKCSRKRENDQGTGELFWVATLLFSPPPLPPLTLSHGARRRDPQKCSTTPASPRYIPASLPP